MLFMVLEKYKDMVEVYRRFDERGRMLSDGVRYIESWVSLSGDCCYQIMECADEASLHKWASCWSDIVDFEFVPVMSSNDMKEKMADSI